MSLIPLSVDIGLIEFPFGEIPGVEIYFGDIILCGVDEVSHDRALKEVFQRALENNIEFNFQKFQYKLNEVVFLGQVKNGIKPDK